MTAPLAIQPPHIDPGIFQRSSSGGESGLEPLISALQFYKKSKLDEQRNQIDAQRTASESNLQGAQADALRAHVQHEQDSEDAWQKQIKTAPATLQPFLQAINGIRGLDPELQRVVAPIIARQIPGFQDHPDPQTLSAFSTLLHTGLPLGVGAKIFGIDLDSLGVPKSYQNWQYQPPGDKERDDSRQLRALGTTFNQADKEITQAQKEIGKEQERIATTVMQARQPGRPLLVPPKFDPSDDEMRRQFHQWLGSRGLDKRLPILMRDREDARTKIQGFAGQQSAAGSPAGDLL